MMICIQCEREWPEDRFNLGCAQPEWCFAGRSKTMSYAFGGGKSYFHESTEAERGRVAMAEARTNGLDPVPVETGKAWNTGAGSTISKIGDLSKKAGAFGSKPAASKVESV